MPHPAAAVRALRIARRSHGTSYRTAPAARRVEIVLRAVSAAVEQVLPGADMMSWTLIRHGRPNEAWFFGDGVAVVDEWQFKGETGPCTQAASQTENVIIPDTWLGPHRLGHLQPRTGRGHCGPQLHGRRRDRTPGQRHHPQCRGPHRGIAGSQPTGAGHGVPRGDRAGQGHPHARTKCNADEAFALLCQMSSHTNRKPRDIAKLIVAGNVTA